MLDRHNETILNQFTRQAVPFATAPAIRNAEALQRVVSAVQAGPKDLILDVACGPGLLVCAFAKVVRHALGIDLTPAMLHQARCLQEENGLRNVSWQQGDVESLPYRDASFSIVASRFALHHLRNPLAVLKQMRRVCAPGGRIAIADSAPAVAKAEAFNRVEKLRDPSHVQAFPVERLLDLVIEAGFTNPKVELYRLEGELEDLLRRSFPEDGDGAKIRAIFTESLDGDTLDMAARQQDGSIYFSFPVAVISALAA